MWDREIGAVAINAIAVLADFNLGIWFTVVKIHLGLKIKLKKEA